MIIFLTLIKVPLLFKLLTLEETGKRYTEALNSIFTTLLSVNPILKLKKNSFGNFTFHFLKKGIFVYLYILPLSICFFLSPLYLISSHSFHHYAQPIPLIFFFLNYQKAQASSHSQLGNFFS